MRNIRSGSASSMSCTAVGVDTVAGMKPHALARDPQRQIDGLDVLPDERPAFLDRGVRRCDCSGSPCADRRPAGQIPRPRSRDTRYSWHLPMLRMLLVGRIKTVAMIEFRLLGEIAVMNTSSGFLLALPRSAMPPSDGDIANDVRLTDISDRSFADGAHRRHLPAAGNLRAARGVHCGHFGIGCGKRPQISQVPHHCHGLDSAPGHPAHPAMGDEIELGMLAVIDDVGTDLELLRTTSKRS